MGQRHIAMTIEGKEYVALPRAEYLKITGAGTSNEALEYTLASLGRGLRRAREHAGLTQAALAAKLKRTQSTVSQAEAGQIRVSEAYVKKLLKVCGLPEDWNDNEPAPRTSKRKAR